jgi:hypothetical protein
MWATLAFVSALSLAPAQAGPLKIVNDRATYGILGSQRPDNDLLPGDIYFVTFEIDGLQTKEGKFSYSIGMEFLDKDGKSEFKREPQKAEGINTLGGNRLPAFAAAEVGTETKPGEYTLKVTVADNFANKNIELVRKFKVLPKSFGLVRLHLTYLQQIPAPPQLLAPGQSVLINCMAVNFKRDDKTKQPSIAIEIRILDDKGQPTLPEAFKDEVTKGVEESMLAIPIALPLDLNRAGKFTVVLKATDRIAKTEYEVKFPLNVVELK